MFNIFNKKEEVIKKILLNELRKKINPTTSLSPAIDEIANYCIDRVGANNLLKIKRIVSDISKRN